MRWVPGHRAAWGSFGWPVPTLPATAHDTTDVCDKLGAAMQSAIACCVLAASTSSECWQVLASASARAEGGSVAYLMSELGNFWEMMVVALSEKKSNLNLPGAWAA